MSIKTTFRPDPAKLAELRRLEAKIEEAEAAVEAAKRAREAYAREWAQADCPAKPGAVVPVTGVSFRGKEMSVERVTVHNGWGGRLSWVAVGPVLKKDGTPSVYSGRWSMEFEREGGT